MKNSLAKIAAKSPAALLLLGFAITQANATTISFPAVFNTTNPCTNVPLTVHGTTTLSITRTPKNIVVFELFFGSEGGYDVLSSGIGKFSTGASTYPVTTYGVWVGPASFRSTAVDQISATDNGLVPTGDLIPFFNDTCGL
jgi:hypothetical protein